MANLVPVDDLEILRQLNAETHDARVPVTDPDILRQLNSPQSAQAYTSAAGAADAADLLGGFLFPDKAAPAPVPQEASPSTAADMAASAGAGVVRGTAETAMLPVTLKRLGEAAVDGTLRGVENAGRSLLGYPTVSAEDFAKRGEGARAGFGNVLDRNVNAGQDAARQAMDETLYAPRSTAGAYARTVGEFAPGIVAGGPITGGLRGAVTRTAGDVIAPALMSETAGKMTEGTALEPWARVAGGLAGNVGAGMARSRFGTPEGVSGAAARGVTPDQFDQARQLAAAGREMGIPLTGPEAISSVTGGGTRLPQAMRYVEGSVEGGARTAPFFAERPGQVDNVMQALLNSISPPSAAPSLLGPRAAELANGVIRGVEQQRTAATEPLYRAANGQHVDADAVRGIIGQLDQTAHADTSGLLAGTIGDVRRSLVERPGTPEIPGSPAIPATMGMPEIPAVPGTPATPLTPVTDVENLNRIRKHYTEQTEPLVPGQSSATKEQNRPVNVAIGQVAQLLDNIPAFANAQTEFGRLSRELVDPIANGPVGRLAKANATEKATGVLLPAKPLPNGQAENADAATRLMAAEAAPGVEVGPTLPTTVPEIARVAVEMPYDAARKGPLSGNNQHVGAKTANSIAGNPDQRANLDAILRTLPGGQALADRANNILDVLFASGHRLGEGSPTAGNLALQGTSKGGNLSMLASPQKWLGAARDAADGWATTRDAGRLADMFLAPNSVDLIQQAATGARSGGLMRLLSAAPGALGRLFVQTPTEMLRTR